MGRFNNPAHVGLRDRITRVLIVVYPEAMAGSDEEVYRKVEAWFNNQGYSLGDGSRMYFVDTLTEGEFKSWKK